MVRTINEIALEVWYELFDVVTIALKLLGFNAYIVVSSQPVSALHDQEIYLTRVIDTIYDEPKKAPDQNRVHTLR